MKRHIIYQIWGILALCFIGQACSDDENENPFTGTDNYLTSFQLTKEGHCYKAIILSDSIYVDVPENVDLTDATVEYACCENAVIFPKPSELKAWNESQLFVVTAYGRAEREYVYTVRRQTLADVVHEGNLVLRNQSDVEKLAQSGVTIIRGNLIIGEETGLDSVFTLASLTAIRAIDYNLILNGTFAGTDLKGLENLEKLGGLKIGKIDVADNPSTAANRQSFVRFNKLSLPALQQVGSDFVMNYLNLDTLTLPALKTIGGDFFCCSNTLAKVELGVLENVGGFFHLLSATNNALLEEVKFPELKQIGGLLKMNYFTNVKELEFPQLLETAGCKLYYMSGIESLDIPLLTKMNGNLDIRNSDKLATITIPQLTTLNKIYFSYNKSLETIDMTALTEIHDEFYIYGSPVLASLEGFSALEHIDGKMTLSNMVSLNSSFERMLALKKVKNVELNKLPLVELNLTSLQIQGNLAIISLDYLAKIKGTNNSMEGDLEYSNTTTSTGIATEIFELEGITELKGKLNIKDVRNVTSLSFPNLEKAGGIVLGYLASKCTEVSFPKLKESGLISTNGNGFSGVTTFSMPELTRISGDFELMGKVLENIDFPKLTTIEGALNMAFTSSYYSNTKLQTVEGLNALTSVGSVKIAYYNVLKDYSGLKGVINRLEASQWNVKNCAAYTPTFADMQEGRYTNE